MSKRKEPYRTEKGVDEREIPFPSTYSEAQVNELKRRGIKFINWRGTSMAVGPGMSTEFYDEISRRKKERMSVIIALLGAPGRGKTWAGLRICEILDDSFSVSKQVCFSRQHFMKIISGEIKIKPGQCILMDEAHMAAGARHWFEDLQKDMVDQIATIRSLGIILIFVVLHLSMIDSIIRKFVLTYQLHMESRGVVTQYRVTMPRFGTDSFHPREGKIGLAVPGVGECSSPDCLWCPDRDWCMNMRAIYERAKNDYLVLTRDVAVKRADQAQLADDPVAREQLMFDLIYDNKKGLRFTKIGTIDPSSIREILVNEGHMIGRDAATDLAKRLQWRHPDLKPPIKDDV